MFVTAVIPPGNILAEFQKVKSTLFREFGLASLYAFPPMVPLAVTLTQPAEPPLHSVVRQTGLLETRSILLEGSQIVISFEACSPIDDIVLQLELSAPGIEDAPIRACTSLLLGYDETGSFDTARCSDLIESSGSEIRLRWKKSRVECLKVTLGQHPYWWEKMFWQTCWKKQLTSPARAR